MYLGFLHYLAGFQYYNIFNIAKFATSVIRIYINSVHLFLFWESKKGVKQIFSANSLFTVDQKRQPILGFQRSGNLLLEPNTRDVAHKIFNNCRAASRPANSQTTESWKINNDWSKKLSSNYSFKEINENLATVLIQVVKKNEKPRKVLIYETSVRSIIKAKELYILPALFQEEYLFCAS